MEESWAYLSPSESLLCVYPVKLTSNGQNKTHIFINGLRGLKRYYIDFYNTRYGTLVHTERDMTTSNGKLKVKLPDMTYNNNPDLAYKIYRDYWRELIIDSVEQNDDFTMYIHDSLGNDEMLSALNVTEFFTPIIHPNPASSLLQIILPQDQVGNMILRDIHGKMILSQPVEYSQQSIIVAHLSNGIYILELYHVNGIITRHKIIISH
jgi:hypothetical protein